MRQRYERLATNWRTNGMAVSLPKPSIGPLGLLASRLAWRVDARAVAYWHRTVGLDKHMDDVLNSDLTEGGLTDRTV